MKKVLLTSLIAGVFCLGQVAMANSPYGFLGPQNEGNRNFATLKQHQFEKEETLDFVNNPEQYKEMIFSLRNRVLVVYLHYQVRKFFLKRNPKIQCNT